MVRVVLVVSLTNCSDTSLTALPLLPLFYYYIQEEIYSSKESGVKVVGGGEVVSALDSAAFGLT